MLVRPSPRCDRSRTLSTSNPWPLSRTWTLYRTVPIDQMRADVGRTGMPHRVADRFGDDAKNLLLELHTDPAWRAFYGQGEMHLAPLGQALARLAQRGRQIVPFERLRSEIPDRLAGVTNELLHLAAHATQPILGDHWRRSIC